MKLAAGAAPWRRGPRRRPDPAGTWPDPSRAGSDLASSVATAAPAWCGAMAVAAWMTAPAVFWLAGGQWRGAVAAMTCCSAPVSLVASAGAPASGFGCCSGFLLCGVLWHGGGIGSLVRR
ncbi:hypothetical protein BS78_01G265200 [Paspalum vaginatum]|nr:hypothetical protein BS78_01G265200 [Paspalum vaginatum]